VSAPEPRAAAPAAAPPPHGLREIARRLVRWESALVLLLLAVILFGASVSPAFLRSDNFFYVGLNVGEVAIMALPLALVIITAEIDLSVASVLGLSGVVLAELYTHGWPIAAAIVAALAVGVACGLLNGLLVTRLGLPSLAVTIGTLALFRGIAQIILPNDTLAGFPPELTKIGIEPIPGTQIPYSIAIFGALAVIVAIILHATPLGRAIFAIGANQEAAFFSGIRVKRIRLGVFVASGLLSALAGVLWTFRFASARYDAGIGLELEVITAALLGGISIFGGRGTIIGVVLAVAILGALGQALTLDNVSAQQQAIVVGSLLLLSVIIPSAGGVYQRARGQIRSFRQRRRAEGARAPAGREAAP
jgi:rhamnose transport system permease protein